MTDLNELRQRIDEIDTGIRELLMERMAVSVDIAAYKEAHGMAVLDRSRERDNIERAANAVPPELSSYAMALQSLLMEASRDAQHRLLDPRSRASAKVSQALQSQPAYFPLQAHVACQGVEGAYQQLATDRIFRHSHIDYYDTFADVFDAVEAGDCEFGILPIENSTAGSVDEVYDLMRSHDIYIVRSCRLKIDHNLLVVPGTKREDVRIVYSHEQAIRQCADYLSRMPGVEVRVCENTAKAAELVAKTQRPEVAAIASVDCAQLYGLSVLEDSIQDHGNNFTRFACIAKDLTIYPGADRTSLMVIFNHEPGSLYTLLSKFYALDINLIKLESRPLPQRNFEFIFYFDIEYPAAAPQFLSLIDSLGDACEEYRYLGSYTEVV